jgi:hypothetical protein
MNSLLLERRFIFIEAMELESQDIEGGEKEEKRNSLEEFQYYPQIRDGLIKCDWLNPKDPSTYRRSLDFLDRCKAKLRDGEIQDHEIFIHRYCSRALSLRAHELIGKFFPKLSCFPEILNRRDFLDNQIYEAILLCVLRLLYHQNSDYQDLADMIEDCDGLEEIRHMFRHFDEDRDDYEVPHPHYEKGLAVDDYFFIVEYLGTQILSHDVYSWSGRLGNTSKEFPSEGEEEFMGYNERAFHKKRTHALLDIQRKLSQIKMGTVLADPPVLREE